MNNLKTINKIKRTVDRKFSYYPETKEVLDLKEELLSIMMDKYNDLTDVPEKQKYRECMEIMSSYKEVLHDIEIKSSHPIFKNKMLAFSIFGTIYFLTVVIVYLAISQFVVHSYRSTCSIVVIPSIIFVLITAIYMFIYCKKMKLEVLTRICLGLSFFALAVTLYVVPCFFLATVKHIYIWHPTWLVFLAVGYIYLLVDKLVYPHSSPKMRLLRNCLNLLALVTTIYLTISFFIGYWSVTWLIFVVCLLGCEVYILLYMKSKL